MRTLAYMLIPIMTILISGCGKATHEDVHTDKDTLQQDGLSAYDEVMKLHDEGMAKMDQLYVLKKKLQDEIASSKDMVAEKREKINSVIQQIDSARQGMMEWMHKFQPAMDSIKLESYKPYLDAELEKVKKVKEDIFAAIHEATAATEGEAAE